MKRYIRADSTTEILDEPYYVALMSGNQVLGYLMNYNYLYSASVDFQTNPSYTKYKKYQPKTFTQEQASREVAKYAKRNNWSVYGFYQDNFLKVTCYNVRSIVTPRNELDYNVVNGEEFTVRAVLSSEATSVSIDSVKSTIDSMYTGTWEDLVPDYSDFVPFLNDFRRYASQYKSGGPDLLFFSTNRIDFNDLVRNGFAPGFEKAIIYIKQHFAQEATESNWLSRKKIWETVVDKLPQKYADELQHTLDVVSDVAAELPENMNSGQKFSTLQQAAFET